MYCHTCNLDELANALLSASGQPSLGLAIAAVIVIVEEYLGLLR